MRLQRHTTRGHMRRMVLVLAAMALAVVGLVLVGDILPPDNQRADAQTAERPNFVFVLTDDLDERSMDDLPGIRDVMGANGDTGMRSTTFENAYVTFPLCCPSASSE